MDVSTAIRTWSSAEPPAGLPDTRFQAGPLTHVLGNAQNQLGGDSDECTTEPNSETDADGTGPRALQGNHANATDTESEAKDVDGSRIHWMNKSEFQTTLIGHFHRMAELEYRKQSTNPLAWDREAARIPLREIGNDGMTVERLASDLKIYGQSAGSMRVGTSNIWVSAVPLNVVARGVMKAKKLDGKYCLQAEFETAAERHALPSDVITDSDWDFSYTKYGYTDEDAQTNKISKTFKIWFDGSEAILKVGEEISEELFVNCPPEGYSCVVAGEMRVWCRRTVPQFTEVINPWGATNTTRCESTYRVTAQFVKNANVLEVDGHKLADSGMSEAWKALARDPKIVADQKQDLGRKQVVQQKPIRDTTNTEQAMAAFGLDREDVEPEKGKITSLYLYAKSLTDSDLEYLEAFPDLEELVLMDRGLTDAALEPLRHLKKLRCLEIGHGQFTDAGIKHLHALHNLKELTIVSKGVTDDGLPELAKMKKLKRLELCWVTLSRSAVERLEKAMPNCYVDRLGMTVTDESDNDDGPLTADDSLYEDWELEQMRKERRNRGWRDRQYDGLGTLGY